MENIVRLKQVFYQFFMWSCMFNLTYFVACSVLFFKIGTKSNPLSLLLFSIQAGILIYLIIKFIFHPYNFKYFWNSFYPKKQAMNHYLIYISVIILSVISLGTITQSFVALIPYVFMFIYTLIYKPYKDPKDNNRSAFNMFVTCLLISFKVYIQYYP